MTVPVFDLLVLSQVPGIGANRLRSLVSRFDTPTAVFDATAKEIAQLEGFSKTLATETVHFLKGPKLDLAKRHVERQLSVLNKVEGMVLTFWDRRYPDLLKKIYDPPAYLFVRGNFDERDIYAVAIVGTRKPTEYGESLAEKFSQELSLLGITIVSGLARGVDTISHASALKAGGRTIAVIGSGIDICYPAENRLLAERIIANGAIVSEYEMGAKPDAANFPKRNRIISGLSLGTLLVETDISGGAMITATTAADQNREVFAIPGSITSRISRGCHALIKEGRATLVESVDDIIRELEPKLRPILKGSAREQREVSIPLSLFERSLIDILSDSPLHIDLIAERTKLSTADALINLLSLEFKGLVKQHPGKQFTKTV